MVTLAMLQKKMFSSLVYGEAVDKEIFNNNSTLSIEESISIYQKSCRLALLNTMRDTFEVCVKITGDDFFNAMAELYIKETPSRNANIDCYGESFVRFVAEFQPAMQLPYLSDVAQLEWFWHKALHSENSQKFNPTALADLPEKDHAKIIFQLPLSAQMIESPYPIDEIWHFNQEGYVGEQSINLNKGGVKLLVWRQEMNMRIDSLQKDEWDFLSAIEQGVPMGELDEVLSEEQAAHMSEMLADFVRKGWIAGYRF
jgi:hypothetical protein